MKKITAVVLTYNEEQNIRRCLESVADWCPIIVVDSYSTDNTKEVAKEFGALVLENKYLNHSSQWNWTLNNIPNDIEWILALDADFIVTDKLKKELDKFLEIEEQKYNGFYVIHEYVFWGSHIRYGGIKKYWLRGIRRGYGEADKSDLVDFRFNIEGKVKNIHAKVIEDNEKDDDFSFWVRKQDLFSFRLAVEEEIRRRGLLKWEGQKGLFGNSDMRIKSLRDIWLRFPLFIRPFIYFFYRYFLTLGFLDGIGGFIYHFQQGLWLRMVVDMKIYEIRQANLSDKKLLDLSNYMLNYKSGSLSEILKIQKNKILAP